jgi:hypothetical protein
MGRRTISGPRSDSRVRASTLHATCGGWCRNAQSGQNRESEAWRRLPGTREGQRTLGLQGNRLQGNRLKGDKQDCIPAKALTR